MDEDSKIWNGYGRFINSAKTIKIERDEEESPPSSPGPSIRLIQLQNQASGVKRKLTPEEMASKKARETSDNDNNNLDAAGPSGVQCSPPNNPAECVEDDPEAIVRIVEEVSAERRPFLSAAQMATYAKIIELLTDDEAINKRKRQSLSDGPVEPDPVPIGSNQDSSLNGANPDDPSLNSANPDDSSLSAAQLDDSSLNGPETDGPGRNSQKPDDPSLNGSKEDGPGPNNQKSDHACQTSLNPDSSTFGLKPSFLKSLDITPPINKWVRVTNFRCDKSELRDVMELAGNVILCSVVHKNLSPDNFKKFAIVKYSHPLEAVQAVSLLNGQMYYGLILKVAMLNKSPDDIILPNGLSNIGTGLGLQGKPIRDIEKQYQNYTNNQNSSINTNMFLKDGESDDEDLMALASKNAGSFEIKHAEDYYVSEENKDSSDAAIGTDNGKNLSLANASKDVVNRHLNVASTSKDYQIPGGFADSTMQTEENYGQFSSENSPMRRMASRPASCVPQAQISGNFGPATVPTANYIALGPATVSGPQNMQGPMQAAGIMHSPGPIQTNQMHASGPMQTVGSMQTAGQVISGWQAAGWGEHTAGSMQMSGPMHSMGQQAGPMQTGGMMQAAGQMHAAGHMQAAGPMQAAGQMHAAGPIQAAGQMRAAGSVNYRSNVQTPVHAAGHVSAPMAMTPQTNSLSVQFVNLPPSTTFPFLCERLSHTGQVVSLQFTTPGCAIATFGHPTQAQKCYQTYNGMIVEGYRITVNFI
ncbi:uncharacterized protein LOC142978755 [Anticarsia gemmatalis]|uniref:uncharacterized protein LOC142978755 n=1 Tax=Anticarsia gemmatalis TaxID=129554 RepID=UPI003F75A673